MYSVFANIRTVGDFFRSIKWAWQRATKGYCDLDTYGVGDWFLNTLPDMLESIKNNRVGFPSVLLEEGMNHYGLKSMDEYNAASEELRDKVDAYGNEKWGEILSEMIFLLREANEDTCSKVNPYVEEYHRVSEDFRKKYGEWGEKLLTEEEKETAKKTGHHPVYFPYHLPEYKESSDRFYNEAKRIHEYQLQCKDKALEMFSKWFYSLWI